MSSEPNPKIDELLKRYVQQRKGEARADFELHPATRNLLQSEVARRFPKTGEGKKRSLIFLLWPRLAIAGAFTALLAVTVMVLNKPKEKGTEVAQTSSKERVPLPSQSSPSGKPVLSDRAESSALAKAKTPEASPTGEPEIARRSGPAVIGGLSQKTDSKPLGQIAQPERNLQPFTEAPVKFSRDSVAKNEDESASAGIGATPAAPAQTKLYADMESRNRWQFVQQDLRARYRENLLSPAQPKILQSFELIRTGDKIRLIDSDGSIYEGEILAVAEDKLEENDLEPGLKKNSQFAFRVVGTNQPLNRVVSFTGEFAPSNEPVVLNEIASATTRDAVQAAIAGRSETSTVRGLIHGKVSIGGTNEFELRATTELPK